MMAARVALCLDDAMRQDPGLIGLDGESLESQAWLDVFLSGEEARRALSQNEAIEEAWVVASDDVEPINLAATLKADRPDLNVKLVAFEGCGSLYSRAHTALIDEVVDNPAFVRCYTLAKSGYSETGVALRSEPKRPVAIAKASRAFLLPVVSGSGGAGKSSVSVVGAHIARAMGYRTLLLDYDLQFGDVAVMAGVENALTVDEAISRPDRLDQELKRDPGFAVIAAPPRLEAAESVVRAIPGFLDDVSESFDVIVANTGAAWAEQHAALLERCSAALFLIDQRASSIRACRHALELCARCGIASGPFRFAVNRCSKNAPLSSIDVSCALQGAPVFELKDGGRDVEDYLSAGAVTDLFESRNDFCISLEHVMSRMLPGSSGGTGNPPDSADDARPSKRRVRGVGRRRGRGA